MKTDVQPKNDVCAELDWDPSINASQVGVAVKESIVTLTGHLDTYAEKHAVERAVQRVDVMSSEPVVAPEQAALIEALAVMRSKGVRRLVVTDTQGLLQGVLALDDVIEVVSEQLLAVARALASGRGREQRNRP